MELSPSRQADSCTDRQELPSNFMNQKVHYSVHKSSLCWLHVLHCSDYPHRSFNYCNLACFL
jgi:hypothetical protein